VIKKRRFKPTGHDARGAQEGRDVRFKRMTAAIEDKVPKAQIARERGMDRTNLYTLLEGKDVEQDGAAR
jgi:hypothetical protein